MGEFGFGSEIFGLINTLMTIFLGGGWFLHWRASKRKANGEAKQVEADAFKSMQDAYQQMHEDLLKRLDEVCGERDHYKDKRDEERKINREMRAKYNELENRMTQMDLRYKQDISRLGRRIDVLSPFLCGVAGCIHRKKVSLMENIDDNSFSTNDDLEEVENNEEVKDNQK